MEEEEEEDEDEEEEASMTAGQDSSSSSFFSLLRDLFRCNPGGRLGVVGVERAVGSWQRGGRAGGGWRRAAEDWAKEVPSAVSFLCGHFPEAQPPSFAPFLAPFGGGGGGGGGVYQWVGSGRDSDAALAALSRRWRERRHQCQVGNKELLR